MVSTSNLDGCETIDLVGVKKKDAIIDEIAKRTEQERLLFSRKEGK
ncbi:MAG TPA: hypothetical protein VEI81_07520 [Methanoregula sp.]|nr:hypothetical protein [Methanoregula sp.]